MPSSSHLRLQTSFEPFNAEVTRSHFVTSPPQKKPKMSITEAYYIAASARTKLGKEASRPDHHLRRLVLIANQLDSLMIDLAEAEKKQEEWFNNTIRKASRSEEPRHIQWVDTIAEQPEEEDDSDSDSDYEEDFDMIAAPRRIVQAPVHITTTEIEEEEEEDDEDYYDDMEDDADLALTRVPSQSPPELVMDDESDDESPPQSPPQPTLEFSQKEAMLTTSFYNEKSDPIFDFSIPESTAPLITSY